MAVVNFPPIELADEHGLLALGGDLEISSLLLAYSRGIFPWPISDEYPLAWFCPNPRGVIPLDQVHLPKSFKKFIRHCHYHCTFNQSFKEVIVQCQQIHAQNTQGQTWITDDIVKAYIKLHHAGHAYSVETRNAQGDLVGGLYGVTLGGYVSGESMFYKSINASKFALAQLLSELQKHQVRWLDTQMVTPVVGSLGGQEIPRSEFLLQLKEALRRPPLSFLTSGPV